MALYLTRKPQRYEGADLGFTNEVRIAPRAYCREVSDKRHKRYTGSFEINDLPRGFDAWETYIKGCRYSCGCFGAVAAKVRQLPGAFLRPDRTPKESIVTWILDVKRLAQI